MHVNLLVLTALQLIPMSPEKSHAAVNYKEIYRLVDKLPFQAYIFTLPC